MKTAIATISPGALPSLCPGRCWRRCLSGLMNAQTRIASEMEAIRFHVSWKGGGAG